MISRMSVTTVCTQNYGSFFQLPTFKNWQIWHVCIRESFKCIKKPASYISSTLYIATDQLVKKCIKTLYPTDFICLIHELHELHERLNSRVSINTFTNGTSMQTNSVTLYCRTQPLQWWHTGCGTSGLDMGSPGALGNYVLMPILLQAMSKWFPH
jgi:hypothetical protein